MYQVTKRDGSIAAFDIKKIAAAITKAFDACGKQYHPSVIDMLALNVTAHFEPKIGDGLIGVEDIQGSVEAVLPEAGYADVADDRAAAKVGVRRESGVLTGWMPLRVEGLSESGVFASWMPLRVGHLYELEVLTSRRPLRVGSPCRSEVFAGRKPLRIGVLASRRALTETSGGRA